MERSFVIVDYFRWHYTTAFRDVFIVWLNLVWFVMHFFSIPLLLRTLFAPWKRISEVYGRTGLEDLMATLLVNTMTRIVGAVIRFAIILVGCLVLLVVCLGLAAVLVAWVVLPLFVVYIALYGVTLLLL